MGVHPVDDTKAMSNNDMISDGLLAFRRTK
jgi:hypothetical protein